MTGQVDIKAVWPDWEIEKRIGSGSFGTVYRAKKTVGETDVYSAVKVITIPFTDSEVDSLAAEGLSVSDSIDYYKQLTDDIVKEVSFMESCKGNTNIVSVEDYSVSEKEEGPGYDIFIRMELLTPLNSYLCDKTLDEREVIKLGIDICNALLACEKKKIIHRDIKPENIFVNVFGDYKLGDFGIARSLEGMTFGFSQKGTFNYMAPEVFNSSFYDFRADIYSLGIVLYRLLNKNRLPFLNSEKQLLSPTERRLAVERRLKGDEIPPIAGISAELSDVVTKACSFKPEDRYESAEAMKSALEKVLRAIDSENASAKVPAKRSALVKALICVCVLLFVADVFLGVLIHRNHNVVTPQEETEIIASPVNDIISDAERLIDEGKPEEAGYLLLDIVKRKRFSEIGLDEVTITNGNFDFGDRKYEIAKQYWDRNGARFALYFYDLNDKPDSFHFRYVSDKKIYFYYYDMEGNYWPEALPGAF